MDANSSTISRACRLCLAVDGVKLPIFDEEGQKREFALKIRSCLSLEADISDPLPHIICHKCVYKLDTLHDFRETSRKCDTFLRENLITTERPTSSLGLVPIVKTERDDGAVDYEPAAKRINTSEGNDNRYGQFYGERSAPYFPEGGDPASERSHQFAFVDVDQALPAERTETKKVSQCLAPKVEGGVRVPEDFPSTRKFPDLDKTLSKNPSNVTCKDISINKSISHGQVEGSCLLKRDEDDNMTPDSGQSSLPKMEDKDSTTHVALNQRGRIVNIDAGNKIGKLLHCKFCPRHFDTKTDLHCHRCVGDMKCYICGEKFNKYYSLVYHTLLHSDMITYTCRSCNFTVSNKSTFVKHLNKHRPSLHGSLCIVCRKHFLSLSSLVRHNIYVHNCKGTKLEHVQFKSTINQSSLPNMSDISGEKRKSCRTDIFHQNDNSKDKNDDVKDKNEDVKDKNDHSKDKTDDVKDKNDHSKDKSEEEGRPCEGHKTEKSFECMCCYRKYATKLNLFSHRCWAKFRCPLCREKQTSYFCLLRHILCHEDMMPYMCNVCMYVVSNQSDFVEHIQTHGDISEPYMCNICSLSFKLQNALASHYINAHDCRGTQLEQNNIGKMPEHKNSSKNRKMRVCKNNSNNRKMRVRKDNSNIGKMTEHKNTENVNSSGSTKYSDNVTTENVTKQKRQDNSIDKKGKISDKSKKEKYIDDGQKHYRCKLCPETFLFRSGLVHHTCIGGSNCHLCGKATANYQNRITHTLLHVGMMIYKCRVCNFSVCNKWKFKEHIKKHHPSAKKLYKCTLCDVSHRCPTEFALHTAIVHDCKGTKLEDGIDQNGGPKKHPGKVKLETKGEECSTESKGGLGETRKKAVQSNVLPSEQDSSGQTEALPFQLPETENTSMQFPCRLCEKSFDSGNQLVEHMMRLHVSLFGQAI